MAITHLSINKAIMIIIFIPLILNISYFKFSEFNFALLTISAQYILFLAFIKNVKKQHNANQTLIIFLFFVLFIIALISGFFSEFQLQSIKISFLIFPITFALLLLIFSVNNWQKVLITSSKVLASLGVLFSSIAIILYFFGEVKVLNGETVQYINLFFLDIYQVVMGMPPNYRVASLTTNPNTLGMLLMISLLSTVFLNKLRLYKKHYFFGAVATQIVTMLLTQSRSAIITFLVMLILFEVISKKNVGEKIISIIVLITLLFFALIIAIIISPNMRIQEGLSNREDAWIIILERIKENPFIGAGFGVSSEAYLSDVGIKAHNIFLNTLSELGALGFLIFLLTWFMGIILSYRGVLKNKNNDIGRYSFAFLFSVLTSLVLHQMVENKLLVYDFIMFLWTSYIALSSFGTQVPSSSGSEIK